MRAIHVQHAGNMHATWAQHAGNICATCEQNVCIVQATSGQHVCNMHATRVRHACTSVQHVRMWHKHVGEKKNQNRKRLRTARRTRGCPPRTTPKPRAGPRTRANHVIILRERVHARCSIPHLCLLHSNTHTHRVLLLLFKHFPEPSVCTTRFRST